MPTRESLVFSLYFSFSFLLLILSLSPICGDDSSPPPQELWCVAKNNAEYAALKAEMDWACDHGAGCTPIQIGQPCYDANNFHNMASYAFNDYFLKHGLTDESCNFDNNAEVTTLNPSHDNCIFPSSLTVGNGSLSNTYGRIGSH